MKNSVATVTIAVIPLVFCFFGCLEIKARTTVSADGSSERVIRLKQETKSLPNAAFPIPTDSTWTIEWKEVNDEKNVQYEYIATKKFTTPGELEREYANGPDTAVLDVKVDLHKRFQWFYTYFDYRETYTLRNPFNLIPITTALTKEEIDHYLYHYSGSLEDSIIDTKVEDWSWRNELEDLFRGLIRVAEQRGDSSLSVLKLMRVKERFLALLTVKVHGPDSKKGEKNDTLFFLKTLEEVSGTKAVYALRKEAGMLIANLEEKRDRLNTANGTYENSVQLPGLLLETNSDKVQGNLVTWKVKDNQLKAGNFVMSGQSRVTNVWAFVITGLVGLVVVVLGLLRVFGRKFPLET